jgi:hypothetical protein
VRRFGNAGTAALLAARDERVRMKAGGDCAACARGAACDGGGAAPVRRSAGPEPEDCGKHLGSCEFYRCRERRHACGKGGYYEGYGLKYCLRFSALGTAMSPAGAAWVSKTLLCLQQYLHANVAYDTPCPEARRSAFDSHPLCYVLGGICSLGPADWAMILATIDLADFDMKQALLTALACAGWWLPLLRPGTPPIPGGGLGGVQRKLEVGASNDPLEIDADRVADRVMAMRAPGAAKAAPVAVQRAGPASGGRSASAPASVERVLASPGQPLEPGLRSDMEGRFGHGFSDVRIHRGHDAERSARDIDASAYTVGRDIVFGAGSYAPGSRSGQRLLAHELAHTLQQGGHRDRIQRVPAGGCAEPGATLADEREEWSIAGIIAHNQIQAKYFPRLQIEAELPRGTKQMRGAGCPEPGRAPGKLDLWRATKGGAVEIGEIKSVNSTQRGIEEVQHYLLRYRQMVQRLEGGACHEDVADEIDNQFVSAWLWRQLAKDALPKAVPLASVVPATETLVGVYLGNPTKLLYCMRVPGGAVVYWCNKNRRRRRDEEDRKQPDKRVNVPLLVGTGAALAASVAAVHWGTGASPGVRPTAPPPARMPPLRAPAPSPTWKMNPPLPPKGGPVTRPRIRVKTPGANSRIGGGRGGIKMPSAGGVLRAAGGAMALWGLYQAYRTIQDAKAQIDALRAEQDALWEEFDRFDKSRKGADKPVAAGRPEKESKVRLFEIARFRLSEREENVPTAALGSWYHPVQFLSLTRPGERTFAVDSAQIDCARIQNGIAGVSGYQTYTGYARSGDVRTLSALFSQQIALARLGCFAAGRVPPPAAAPDGEEVSATLNADEGSLTASCKKVAGGQSWNCESVGNFAAMKALIDDPEELPPNFVLDVTVVRTRNGESQRWDRMVSVWVEDPEHKEPELKVQAEGDVPADATDPEAYPQRDLAYLLELHARWGR